MILSKKLSEAFNAQVNAEMWSSNLYLSMSVHFQKLGLNGFAHWMKKQAEEEMDKKIMVCFNRIIFFQ